MFDYLPFYILKNITSKECVLMKAMEDLKIMWIYIKQYMIFMLI